MLVVTVIRNAETRSLVRMVLDGVGHRVIESSGYPQAQSLLSNGLSPDLLVLESSPASPRETAEYRQLLKSTPKDRICLIMRMHEQGLREEAFELGIKHCLMKPLTSRDLESMVDELQCSSAHECSGDIVFPFAKHSASIASLPPDMPAVPRLEELGEGRFFLAACPQMLEIYRQVKLLADVDVNVLILGESGTGKEVIAHLIHRYSRRSANRFENVNCAALPEGLLESELFGYRQGAFTGAIRDTPGKFDLANRGTLLS